ncbi:hypothetical protein ZIOFF_026483 [Zingiber officinale]|uniref:Dilute domain-containing protein n=1 Tax=Zingiber officinale TaxID=94328 RepID=A0A8J5H486_ZINOF|nr:hypothetical protein ZIOFF_026483 [Zingiber officinale]
MNPHHAHKLFDEMGERGLTLDKAAYNALVGAFAGANDVRSIVEKELGSSKLQRAQQHAMTLDIQGIPDVHSDQQVIAPQATTVVTLEGPSEEGLCGTKDTNSDISIGSEICDKEHIESTHAHKPTLVSESTQDQDTVANDEKTTMDQANENTNHISDFLENNENKPVPSFFIRKLVIQLFAFINIQLFNSLLLRRECCTFSNGEYVKSGLTLLEKWISDVTEEYAGTSWHELNYIRQAVGFLIIHQKRKKTLEEITQDLCPALSLQQIYRICKMYWDERYGTQSVSSEVVGMMREMVNKDTQNLASNSFLLDDDICIPFSTEDISKAIPAIDPIDIELPQFLQHPPSALVLQQFELTPA